MLDEKQIEEIKAHLDRAQNPLFFFDNDNDGLTSFLLLRRYIGRGKGVVIRSFPDLNISYYRKVVELRPDYIFILDKPIVSEDFIEKAKRDNLPVVWIDHHQVEKPLNDYINYYNPINTDGNNEPVSYISYNITKRKEDLWLALIGNISDSFMPDFYSEFEKNYPELGKKNPNSAFDLLYNSEIGRIARILDFSLKDSLTNVVNMTKFMISVKGPMDVLEENPKTKQILKRFNEINYRYQILMEKARAQSEGKVIYFQYGGNLSLSASLANQLLYEYPGKIIVVVYISGDVANLSLRGGNDIRTLTLEAISGIEGATGGGHKNATGAKMSVSDLPKFKEKIEELVKKEIA
ncbi:MAG: DHHA1 domain-containing protein [Nanoarchaeota archaeon]|nr:DHHA1 domain-containing protein [Nanoarchaeota archaeon]